MVTSSVVIPTGDCNVKLLQAAKFYIDEHPSWSIVATKNKRSAGKWKRYQTRRADAKELAWRLQNLGADGIAIVNGPISGGGDRVHATRDFDVPEAYTRWARGCPELAQTLPTVQTIRGYHVHFLCDGPNRYIPLDDGEFRGNGLTRLPPTAGYRWIIPPGEAVPFVDPARANLLRSILNKTTSSSLTQSNPRNSCMCPKEMDAAVEQAIAATLPSGPGTRNRQVFEFARHLRRFLPPDANRQELKTLVAEWHRRALPVIKTKQFDDTWIDFSIAWERVKRPIGANFAALVASAARSSFPPEADQFQNENTKRVIRLCAHLQAAWGQSPFPLGARELAKALAVSRMEAHRQLMFLVAEGILELVSIGKKSTKRASEYRFVREEH